MAAQPATPDRDDDREPVARWENEGGACAERDAAARPAPTADGAQDGEATLRL
jgi:hypothetical protein